MRNRIEGGVIHALLACPGLFTRTLKWKKSDAVYYSPFLNNVNHLKLVVVLKQQQQKKKKKHKKKVSRAEQNTLKGLEPKMLIMAWAVKAWS